MLRPRSLLPALVAAAAALSGVGAVPASGAAHAAHAAPRNVSIAADDALEVTIDSLNPSTVPRTGPVRVSGTLTNPGADTWVAINLHAFVSTTPITSGTALAAAHDVDPAEYVGDRVLEPGTFDRVDELGPGESTTYSMRVPRSALDVSEPGVYWFGVHAVGEGPEPRDDIADGRARTFLPLLPRRPRSVDAALVLPVRHALQYAADGSIEDPEAWAADLDLGGSLRSLVDVGAASGSRPVTWLVDPAVPEAVRRLTAGNPPRSLADTIEPEPDGETSPPTPTESGSPSPGEDPTEGPDPEEVPQNAATEPGSAWLDRLREALVGDQVLALPWGDLDVSAAQALDPDTYDAARRRTGGRLELFDVPTDHAVSPPTGFIDPTALDGLRARDTVLVGEQMLGGPQAPTVARVGDRRLVAASSAAQGGPGPGDRLAAVPLRQQIIAEAAVRALEQRPRPLVVVLPQDWSTETSTSFWEGLDVPWLDLTDVDEVSRSRATDVDPEDLAYPAVQERRELDAADFAAASELVAAGETLQNLLLRNDQVADAVRGEALSTVSYGSRQRPAISRLSAARARSWIFTRLGSVDIEAPPAVTLSSTRGRFSALVTNDLEFAVRVRVRAVTDAPMVIEGPDLIEVPALGQTSVLLDAATDRLGVSNVQLLVTDDAGTPLGSTDSLPIRSAQVSRVIWLVLGTGVALLFGAIVVRLVARLRRARAAR